MVILSCNEYKTVKVSEPVLLLTLNEKKRLVPGFSGQLLGVIEEKPVRL
jgi:hypothetical protein